MSTLCGLLTRSVNDVEVVVFPCGVGGSTLDGDSLFSLELHRVHLGSDIVLTTDLVNLVDTASVEQDTLGQGSLSRVNVGRDTNVTESLDLALFFFLFVRKTRSGTRNFR